MRPRRAPPARTISAISVHHLLRAAARVGVDPDALASFLGIDLGSAADPAQRVSFEAFVGVWERVMRRTTDSRFPLIAAEIPPTASQSLVTFLCRTSATLADAADAAIRYTPLVTDAHAWRLETSRASAALVLEGLDPARLGERCEAEFTMAVSVRFAQACVRGGFSPQRVAFAHAAPDDTHAHEALFGRALAFGAKRTEIVFARELLARPLLTATPALHRLLERHAAEAMAGLRARATDEERARHAMLATMRAGRSPSAAVVARALGTSARTLQRRLRAEETTFQALLDAARCDLALELLAAPEHATKEIAARLGFADARSFYRAFRRWTGSTPRAKSVSR